MTSDDGSDSSTPFDDMADVFSRVRQLDPHAEEAAVRGYVREIAAAGALLDTIDLRDSPLEVSFSAACRKDPRDE
jgi:hypothetical protein